MERILRNPTISGIAPGDAALPAAVRDALDDAYQRGLAAGYAQASGDLAQAAQVLAAKLDATGDRLVDAVRTAVGVDEETVVDLALAVAAWFVGDRVRVDPDAAHAALDAVLGDIDPAAVYDLYVHPDVADLLAGSVTSPVRAIRPDPGLVPGELRLTTDGLQVERTWKVAIERVRRGLIDGLAHDAAVNGPSAVAGGERDPGATGTAGSTESHP